MAVLPKGGLQIAGHKVPWEAIAAVAGVAGVILVLRARSQGQSATVGQPPVTAASTGFGATGFGPDMSGALANISQQLTTLGQAGLNGPPTPAPPATPDPNLIHVSTFDQWLAGGFAGTRPDLAAAIAGNRWADLNGEYAKEVAASEAQQLAAGKHF